MKLVSALMLVWGSVWAQEYGTKSETLQQLSHAGRVDHITWTDTGLASFVRGDFDYSDRGTPEQIAATFLDEHRGLFRMKSVDAELVVKKSTVDERGNTHISYDQRYQGLPVFHGQLKVHVNPAGHVTSVNGKYIDDIAIGTNPSLGAMEAKRRMIADMGSGEIDSLAQTPQLCVIRVDGTDHLAWRAQVNSQVRDEGWDYFVDASTGSILQRYPLVVE